MRVQWGSAWIKEQLIKMSGVQARRSFVYLLTQPLTKICAAHKGGPQYKFQVQQHLIADALNSLYRLCVSELNNAEVSLSTAMTFPPSVLFTGRVRAVFSSVVSLWVLEIISLLIFRMFFDVFEVQFFLPIIDNLQTFFFFLNYSFYFTVKYYKECKNSLPVEHYRNSCCLAL